MNVAPINGEYFHIAHTKSYISYPQLEVGDQITTGKAINPFFEFYERTREYKVNTPEGPVAVPALMFLKEVKAGVIECPDLPAQALAIANHYNILARELILEEVRLSVNPLAPSRKTCLWVSDSMELAEEWQQKIRGRSRILKLALEGTFHAGDARLMMTESEPLSHAYAKARSYWRSETSEYPLPEILFAGKATVLAIEKDFT